MRALVVALTLLGPGAPASGWMHPLHTALAEISYQPNSGVVGIQLRMFADDLAAAVAAPAGASLPDSVLSAYTRGTLALIDRGGRPVRLQWRGAERSGDTVLLRLEGELAGGLQHARLLAAVMWERFPDQVNIVRASYGGRTVTLLFIR